MPASRFFSPPLLTLTAAALLCAGCSRKDRVEVVDSRAPFKNEPEPRLGLSASQRYGENLAQGILQWQMPEGWNYLTPTEFRHVNFNFGPNREGEVYVTMLSQSGGAMLDNLNRWRKQMDQPPWEEKDLQTLRRVQFFGMEVPLLDITGTYTGGSGPMMAPADPKPGYRMVGAIAEVPGAIFTVKMTGPVDLVEANLLKFETFASGVRPAAKVYPEMMTESAQ